MSNVVVSNIFNIGIVIGLPILLLGEINSINFSYIDIIMIIVSALLLFIFSFNDKSISKKEGIIFLILFVVYYSYVIIGQEFIMNQLKTGLSLVIIGNICYVLYVYFSKDNTTNLSDFLSGLILGLSVGTNIVGITTIAKYMGRHKKK